MIFSQNNQKRDQYTKKTCKQQKRRANECEKREETKTIFLEKKKQKQRGKQKA